MAIATSDLSNGYEDVADDFMCIRSKSTIGIDAVRDWSRSLPGGGCILDLGCGHGLPISNVLVDSGFHVYGIDASPKMAAAFRARFPNSPVECGAIEDSLFFSRQFDGVIAVGVIFLLAQSVQAELIRKVAFALKPGGKFLFTAPYRECEWLDNLTGKKSVSLGSDAYRNIIEAAGLSLVGEAEDEGRNHYYIACRQVQHQPTGIGDNGGSHVGK